MAQKPKRRARVVIVGAGWKGAVGQAQTARRASCALAIRLLRLYGVEKEMRDPVSPPTKQMIRSIKMRESIDQTNISDYRSQQGYRSRAFRKGLAASGHHVVGVARRADDPTFPGTLVPADLADRRARKQNILVMTRPSGSVEGISVIPTQMHLKKAAAINTLVHSRLFGGRMHPLERRSPNRWQSPERPRSAIAAVAP